MARVQRHQTLDRSRRQPSRAGDQHACGPTRGEAVPKPNVKEGPADECIGRPEEPGDSDLLAPALDTEANGVPHDEQYPESEHHEEHLDDPAQRLDDRGKTLDPDEIDLYRIDLGLRSHTIP